MVGASSFMSAFSAWTFTGAAGLAYTYGFVVLVLFWCNALGFLLNWGYFARFARNTRAVTAIEAVRRRLGPVNEQTFTWLQLPFQVSARPPGAPARAESHCHRFASTRPDSVGSLSFPRLAHILPRPAGSARHEAVGTPATGANP
jgi:hypothetical protein